MEPQLYPGTLANNKGADQTAQSGQRMCCSHVTQSIFLVWGPHAYKFKRMLEGAALHVDP